MSSQLTRITLSSRPERAAFLDSRSSIAFAWLLMTASTMAHGDMHEQIVAVTVEIQREPGNAALYLKRAELHRLHQDWVAAAEDYNRAAQLNPNLSAVHLGRGKTLHESGHGLEAAAELDLFLEQNPNHVDGLITRARSLMKCAPPLAAASDFARAIEISPRPEPETYVEHAQALAAAEKPAAAVRTLDEGMTRLGPLPALGLYAIELEVQQRRFDAALCRIDRLRNSMNRQETWLERRGDILAQSDRTGAARESYQAALKALATLPAHIRGTKSMAELEARLVQKLCDLERRGADL
ncbi:MAG: tetratricopeptide repeat protein [Chthoniobacteraceae bacterium]